MHVSFNKKQWSQQAALQHMAHFGAVVRERKTKQPPHAAGAGESI